MPNELNDFVKSFVRPSKFKVFVVLTFTFAGYWLGRFSGNCMTAEYVRLYMRSENHDTTKKQLEVETAKFYRKARLDALQKCCPQQLSLQRLSEQEAKNALRHIIVDRKNKLLYCYIPKVASSNMKRLILTLQNYTDNSNAIKYIDHQGFEFLSDVTASEKDHMIKTFFKFLFVRHPLHRMLSAYRNKFIEPNAQFELQYGRKIVQKYRIPSVPINQVNGKNVTFQEFIRYLIDKETYVQEMNEHWMPMYELCQPCYINYNFIGSFESLTLDTNALLTKLHAPDNIAFPIKQSFYGTSINREAVATFYRSITTEEYKSLHGRYMNDFKCFAALMLVFLKASNLATKPRTDAIRSVCI